MLKRIKRFRRDERGMAFVYVGLGLIAFLSATTLAIDVGMFMSARTQAQNAADAGAHAGAVALAFNSYTDRSSTGPAVTSAVNAALKNEVVGAAVSVGPADVTFPAGASGAADRVRVNVFRTSARGNPVPTLMGALFGVSTVDINATATAEAAPADAESCVMPFTIPDKWIEHVDGACKADGSWSTTSTFNVAETKGNKQNTGKACANPDVYIPPGSEGATGYSPTADKGLLLVLKNSNDSNVAPSWYNPWDLPGSVGGDDYRNNIAGCNTHIVQIGDMMTPENGNMVGPTKQGANDLVAKDPGAHWDTGCNCVKGSAFPVSPRIAIVPLYNPVVYADGQQTGKTGPQLQVANYLGFFIEGMQGNDVMGRITPIGGLIKGNGGPATGAFPHAIRLVQ
jgi:Flp pilus assembly protein TadG